MKKRTWIIRNSSYYPRQYYAVATLAHEQFEGNFSRALRHIIDAWRARQATDGTRSEYPTADLEVEPVTEECNNGD